MRAPRYCFLITTFVSSAISADTKVKLGQLPRPVQDTVKEQTQTAVLVGLSTEVEKGRTTYEIETRVNGKTRDIVVDEKGTILEIEAETDFDQVPVAAKTAIQKRAAGGTITKIETVTRGSAVSYEAIIRTKAGKSIEIAVKADGTNTK